MNLTINYATASGFTTNRDQMRQHLANFVAAYNFAKRPIESPGPHPYKLICKCCTKN